MCRTPSRSLTIGLKSLYSLAGVEVLDNYIWHEESKRWVLNCKLTVESCDASIVPDETVWYVKVDDGYPLGRIDFYPAKKNGIQTTFHHQLYNRLGDESVPWREGNICVRSYLRKFGRSTYDIEPIESHLRLRWNAERAKEWLWRASAKRLVDPGDPFELPHYPFFRRIINVCISESKGSFGNWKNRIGTCGFCIINELKQPPSRFIVSKFSSKSGDTVLEPHWGKYIMSHCNDMDVGVWFLLPEIVVQEPWKAPTKWIELQQFAKQQGLNLEKMLNELAYKLRDDRSHLALIGFPIPRCFGEEQRQIHWQGVALPVLAGKNEFSKGFRPNKLGRAMLDRRKLREERNLDWCIMENWSSQEAHVRGRFHDTITSSLTTIIGGGAIGSMVAEILARGGVSGIAIVDKDKVEVGNLARHTLLIGDIDERKAEALEKRLERESSHINATGISCRFEELEGKKKQVVSESAIIFDCTGSDEVLHYMETFPWVGEKLFCSISVGYAAQRLYVFMARSDSFPRAIVQELLSKHIQADTKHFEDEKLPQDGIGCWSSVFPARVDDMWLAASTATKYFESRCELETGRAVMAVYEQNYENGIFAGISLISEEWRDI